MKLKITLFDEKYCVGCPYSKGICGCNKYLNEAGENINCGCTTDGKPIRLDICKKENR